MRRVRPSIDARIAGFDQLVLRNPIHDTILLGITDDRPDESWDVVTKDGFLQILSGFDDSIPLDGGSDQQLHAAIWRKLVRAVSECPFTSEDAEMFCEFMHKPKNDNGA